MTESYRIVLPGIIYRMLGFSFFGDPAQDLAKKCPKIGRQYRPFCRNTLARVNDMRGVLMPMGDASVLDRDYAMLLENLPVGIQVVRLLYDEHGVPTDYCLLGINRASTNFLGLAREEIIGKKATEFFEHIESEWFLKFGEIVEAGRPERFEMFNQTLGCWFDVLAVPLGETGRFAIIHTDVSARKEAERKLRESEEIFRAISDNSLDNFSILEPVMGSDGEIIDFTCIYQNAVSMTWGKSPRMVVGRRASELFPDFVSSKAFVKYKEVVETGQSQEFEEHHCFDGTDHYYRIVATPVPVGVAVASQSINESKRAKALAQKNEIRQAYLLKLSDIVMSLADEEAIQNAAAQLLMEHLKVNHASYSEFSCDEIIVSRKIQPNSVVPEQATYDRSDLSEWIEILGSGEEVVCPDTLQCEKVSDALRVFWSELGVRAQITVPIVRNNTLVASLSVRDRSPRLWSADDVELVRETAQRTWVAVERARAEKALRESEAKYRTLFETSNDGFWWGDKHGRVGEINQGTAQMLGYTQDEALGMFWTDFICNMWLGKGYKEWEDSESGKPKRHNIRLKKKDGTCIWARVSGSSLEDENGNYTGTLVAFADITEEKKAKEELMESEKKARELVAELEKAHKHKDEFISMLSHELRNPLATIAAALELLEFSMEDDGSSNVIGVVKRQTEHLSRLVDDLLDVTRIGRNKMVLKKEMVTLNTIVTETTSDMRSQFDSKGIALLENPCTDPVAVHADALRITQCVENVLMNALKYTQEDGTVSVTLGVQGEHAVITVQDNGVGIHPDTLDKIFEPYEQDWSSSHSLHNRGLGLGLAIVKSIMEMHDGDVAICSPGLGQGTTVTLRLPTKPYSLKEGES